MRSGIVRTGIIAAALGLPLFGCETGPEAMSGGETLATDDPRPESETTSVSQPGPAPASGTARRAGALVATEPRGTLPYDQFSLPLISPDGRFAATQNGKSASWDQVLARDGAPPIEAMRIEIYRLPQGPGQAEMVAVVNRPALLGRACDETGFLVEAPQSDGSRWIGRADWTTGTVSWLVADAGINAFACLSADGRLAWSRRRPGHMLFELVAQGTDGTVWSHSTDDADWLMPTWGGAGGLFALELRSGFLDAHYGRGESLLTWQDRITTSLQTRATDEAAFQAMTGQTFAVPPQPATQDELIFFHPSRGEMTIWRPGTENSLTALGRGSFSAETAGPGRAIVGTETELYLRDLEDSAQRVQLARGVWIPRRIYGSDWGFILLAPGRGTVEVTALALVDR